MEKLNSAQREAVEKIEGPVMVIAGPGTGKTEILSLRIGNILQKTDAGAKNILCLTYTEAGTVAMRKRLLKYIGADAYSVHIHTFHAFCNMVIQENLDYFGNYRELKPLSDLEEVELLNALIDEFPLDHPFKRLTGPTYYDRRPMKSLFSTLKQENWDAAELIALTKKHIQDEKESDKFIYKRSGKGYQKGDFKEKDFLKFEKKMNRLLAGLDAFEPFQKKLQEAERYDYYDMLRWVNRAFENEPNLLADYQERYLYILVDEFQDTNGIQVDILYQLASFWDQPNLFVVGDDDQAIFRFQGANMENMTDFIDRFSPEVVVLSENYRSSQQILDVSMNVIDHNSERLTKQRPALGLVKKLNQAIDIKAPEDPMIIEYQNEAHEKAAIVKMIMRAWENDEDLSRIAVLYRQHKQVADIVQALEAINVPLNIRRRVNILEEPLVRNIIELLRYIASETSGAYYEDLSLFRIMHFRHWDIEPADIAKLMLDYQKKGKEEEQFHTFRSFLSNPEEVSSNQLKKPEAIINFVECLDLFQKLHLDVSLQTLFERVIYRSGIMEMALSSPERAWQIQLITTLFNHIKSETELFPTLELDAFLERMDLIADNDLSISVQKVIQATNGVHFITAHSAKGLEFDDVYLIGCLKDQWEKSRAPQGFTFPDTIVPAQTENSDEDERRLFYVAMTRARKKLVISYANENLDGKEKEHTKFIAEAMAGGAIERKSVTLTEEDMVMYYEKVFKTREAQIPMVDHSLVDRILENFQMSVTALNKYLECPRAFYFENILRVPTAKAAHMGFGSAIHFALEQYYKKRFQEEAADVDLFSLLKFFERGMENSRAHFSMREYNDQMIHGKNLLTAYFENYAQEMRADVKYELELPIHNVEFARVPIRGILDKVMIDGDQITVFDYKTGKPKNSIAKLKEPDDRNPEGGNYWRQIVFYKILSLADKERNWTMDQGVIDYVQPKDDGTFKQAKIVPKPEHIEFVSSQLVDTYSKIQNYEFNDGCDECQWCDLVNHHFKIENVDQIPSTYEEKSS